MSLSEVLWLMLSEYFRLKCNVYIGMDVSEGLGSFYRFINKTDVIVYILQTTKHVGLLQSRIIKSC